MKKALSFLLALAMLLSIIPMTALTSAAAVDDEAAPTGETYGVSTGEALFAMLEKDTPAGDVMTINVNADISYYVTTQGVTGIDSYLRYACTLGQGKKAPWAAYGSKIESIEIKDGVTAIGAYAFAFLTDRTIEVRLPGNVKTIGEGAFYGVDITGFRICNTDCRIDNYAFGFGDDPDTGTSYAPFETTVAGYKGSTTQKYADKNDHITFYDMNTVSLFDPDSQVIVLTTDPGVELVVTKEDEANFVVVENGVVYSSYEISLQKDGETVQPESPVTVRLPLIGEYDENIKVYRVEADGTLTDMNAAYFDGDLVFTTEHFSRYIIVREEQIPEVTEPENPILLGDVDGDGEVTILDATFIQRELASLYNDTFIEEAADTDGDGGVTILDATFIQRWLANLPSNEYIGKYI